MQMLAFMSESKKCMYVVDSLFWLLQGWSSFLRKDFPLLTGFHVPLLTVPEPLQVALVSYIALS